MTFDPDAVAEAVDEVGRIIRADGGDLVLVAADPVTLRISLALDLSGVSFLDSTICGILVGEAKRRRRAGGELVLVGNGSRATKTLELAGIDRVVRLFPTLQGALDALLVGAA